MGFVPQSILRLTLLRCISHQRKSLSCASVLVGNLECVLLCRQYNAAVPPVVSGRRQASHSHDAAEVLLHRHDLPRTAVRPGALDGGLWLSEIQHKLNYEAGTSFVSF